ncbi:MAG: protein-L-isoaspartate(D-aspartate) O-methyltransferase [Planctomycetes bacterium]|nr:protein-L-isoaspartate(D-aspartate) O-methyltransferase [Planctomycetota bacterium]
MPGLSQRSQLLSCSLFVLAATAVGFAFSDRPSTAADTRDPFTALRNELVDQDIVREGIKNPAVIRAMRTIPRHKFIGPKNKPREAYDDKALPIGHGQTISPPYIVAYMTEALDPQPEDRVLEIGTGSGYQAAILSAIVREVYTIEIVEPLATSAAKVLKDYPNVFPKLGDGYKGWPDKAPFDKIIVTCSPESVPQPLIDQLKEGGKMIIPLGERYEQVFYLFEKSGTELVKKRLLPAVFVPMTGEAEKNRVVLPDPKNPNVHNGSFEKDNDGDGHPTGWHYQRQLKLECGGGAPDGDKFVKFANTEPGRSSHMLQAFPCDGRAVSAIKVSLSVKADQIGRGPNGESACLLVRFYDSERGTIKEDVAQALGPWQGSFGWRPVSKTITVPTKAREGIIFLGLGGAVGELCVDDVRMTPVPK